MYFKGGHDDTTCAGRVRDSGYPDVIDSKRLDGLEYLK